MEAYIFDGTRTPIGKYGGGLSSVRADDLCALPINELMNRNASVNWASVDEVIMGCANQAGEDNRNVARMAALLAGLPETISGVTVNRLCASGMDAIGFAARSIKSAEIDSAIVGGVESMSRAPFVLPKATAPFARDNAVYDTTIGWRFVNNKMQTEFGVDTMPQTADNVADDFGISREDQDNFAYRSQQRWVRANARNVFLDEISPVTIFQERGEARVFAIDEHPRPETSLEKLGALRGINGSNNSVTAGNSSGVNDGAAALLIGNRNFGERNALTPKSRIVGMAATGVAPRIMGIGPITASQKVLERAGLTIKDMDVIELNEAFASQALATLRALGLQDDAEYVNPNGGAIAMGHPLGMTGARLVLTASLELERRQGRYALCTMCVGVGQGVAMIIERIKE